MNEWAFSTLNHSPLLTPGVPIQAQIDAVKAAGFTAIELDVFSLYEADAPADLRGLRCIGLAGLNVYNDEARSVAEAERVIKLCDRYRPEWLLMRLAGNAAANLELLRRFIPAIVETGTDIAFEPSGFTELRTLGQALDAFAAIPELKGRRHGVIPDSWHFFSLGADWSALDALPLENLAYAQIADVLAPSGDPLHDTMQRRGLPGEGQADLARFADALTARGYSGVLSFEVLSDVWRARPAADFARAAFESIPLVVR